MHRLSILAILLSSVAISNSQDWSHFSLQMGVFKSYVGKWKGYSTSKMADGTTQTFQCEAEFYFIIDEKYLEGKTSCSDSMEKIQEKWTYTFDPHKNVYRAWSLSSSAANYEYQGDRQNGGINWKMVNSPYPSIAKMVEVVRGSKMKMEGTFLKADGQVLFTTIGVLEKR